MPDTYTIQNPYNTEKETSIEEKTGACGRFYGKYRGMVLSNVDPMQRGRLLVQVPDVTQFGPASWAEPCFPGRRPAIWHDCHSDHRLRRLGGI